MTISSQIPYNQFTATANQAIFNLTFNFDVKTDLVVYYTPPGVSPNPDTDQIVLDVDYSVTGAGYNNPVGTPVYIELIPPNYPTGADAGAVITIIRKAPYNRTSDFKVGGDFASAVVNEQLDRFVAMVQQLNSNQLYLGLKYEDTDDLPPNRGANILPKLPNKTDGTVPIWTTDTNGNLQASYMTEGSDVSTLRSDLADETPDNNGAGLVGYYNTTSSTSTTVRDSLNILNAAVPNAAYVTGMIIFGIASTAPTGWLLMQNGTIGSPTSGATLLADASAQALYELLWDNITDTYCPVAGGRGASANDDWLNNKPLALPNVTGRSIGFSGTPVNDLVFTADATNDYLDFTTTSSLYSGSAVTLSTTGTLPGGLSPSTTYYITIVSGTSIKLSTSLANYVSSTYIDITSAGTGIHTMHVGYSTFSEGEYLGKEKHIIAMNEMPQHSHQYTSASGSLIGHVDTVSPNTNPLYQVTNSTQSTTTQGGATEFAIMNPTIYFRAYIKL